MSYTLLQLVSSLKEIPANIEGKGINNENLPRIIKALSFDEEINPSLSEMRRFLSRAYLQSRSSGEEEGGLIISTKNIHYFTGKIKKGSDKISYLSLEPSAYVYSFLRQYNLIK